VTTQPDPRLVEAAKHDPTLAYMINKGIPLTRERWIKLNWLGDPPQPWGVEHETEVPELFAGPHQGRGLTGQPHAARHEGPHGHVGVVNEALAILEAADELTVDPADRIAVRRFDEGPRLAARVFAVALDDDDPAVLDPADDVHVNIAHIRRVGHTAALGGEGRRSGESGDKSDG